ncbi:MAG: nucleotidyltransferase domain-containing protein, partial [Bacillota bacterium]|nr:nucleotidyltransferase domain-containing protein [Bacillota bacterium]
MHNVFDVASILVSHAVKSHGQDIAIIAYYGSHATGRASPSSDLDMFYIPDEDKASTLGSQFVLDGLPYDFWPVSWQLAERIADARHHW